MYTALPRNYAKFIQCSRAEDPVMVTTAEQKGISTTLTPSRGHRNMVVALKSLVDVGIERILPCGKAS